MNNDRFKENIREQLNNFSSEDIRFFAWLCAVRSLPFLGVEGSFDFWEKDKQQIYLFAILKAIDITANVGNIGESNVDATYIQSVYNAAGKLGGRGFVYAVNVAANVAGVMSAEDAVRVAIYAKNTAAQNDIDLSHIIYQYLDVIKSGSRNFDGNTDIYKNKNNDIWDNFQKALYDIDCGYWGDWYTALFNKGFILNDDDKEEIKLRMNVSKEIIEKGAAAVARYVKEMTAKNPDMSTKTIDRDDQPSEGYIKISRDLLKGQHLKIVGNEPHIYCSDKYNVVIGPNGGGKTRFLKVVMDYYKKIKKYDDWKIVFADFPHLRYDNNKTAQFLATKFFDSKDEVSLKNFMFNINQEQNYLIDSLFTNPAEWYKQTWEVAHHSLRKFLEKILNFSFDTEKKLMSVKSKEMNLDMFKVYISDHASPGERNLFYMCIFIAALATHRRDEPLAVIIDEPEAHMHVSKVTEFIDLLKKELPNATLWVATHSIHLIPQFEFDELIYLKDGKVQKRDSSTNQQIFNDLIGHSGDLEAYLRDITEWEICRFVAECFADSPETVSKKDDEQTRTVTKEIKNLVSKLSANKKLKILDYGAGTGRVGVALDEMKCTNIVYSTYDLDDKEYNEHIKDKIKCHNTHYTKDNKPRLPSETFDVVLLINTLHEIPATEWVGVFNDILSYMAPNGKLIFGEARVLNIGEYLGKDEKTNRQYGYLVLDETSLQSLFKGYLDIKPYITNKTIIAPIKRSVLYASSITEVNIRDTLETLKRSSFSEYVKLLKKFKSTETDEDTKHTNGRRIAFFLQQYANAQLGLDLLKK